MKKVSVIVPIYNVEQYLAKCLDSIINQTYKNLEIICVNDCSPDNSEKILNEYSKKDDRIKILNREKNGGLSAARNSGLDIATGEYVYFIDSDDWIDDDYLEQMVKKIEDNNVDMILNTNIVKESETQSEHFVWQKYNKKNTEGEFLDKVTALTNSQCMIYCHLYKRDFLINNKLRFPEGYIHEDEYFQHISKILLKELFAFYGPVYHYWQRPNSIMTSRKSKVEPYVKIFSLVYDFYKNNNLLNKENRIKLFRLECMDKINSSQDFLLVKQYLKKIEKDFEEERMASSDYEKYLFKNIKNSATYEEYCTKVGKFAGQLYLTRERILRSKKVKVSVIIPIYNAEKYLRKCLDSVCAQTLEDIEIICVNDCSPDNSLEILKEYASKDNRIKIINFEENKGASTARNAGLKIAGGKYISFVDSDDSISSDFLDLLYNKALTTNADIIKGEDLINIKEDDSIEIVKQNKKIEKNKYFFLSCFYTAIYKKTLISNNSILFPQDMTMQEDTYWLIQAVHKANQIEIVAGAKYYRQRHSDSVSISTNGKKKIEDFCKYVRFVFEILKSSHINREIFNQMKSYFLIYILAQKKEHTEYKEILNNLQSWLMKSEFELEKV